MRVHRPSSNKVNYSSLMCEFIVYCKLAYKAWEVESRIKKTATIIILTIYSTQAGAYMSVYFQFTSMINTVQCKKMIMHRVIEPFIFSATIDQFLARHGLKKPPLRYLASRPIRVLAQTSRVRTRRGPIGSLRLPPAMHP
jgi:hypothetical protein